MPPKIKKEKKETKNYDKISIQQKEILISRVFEEGESITKASKIVRINPNTGRAIVAFYRKNGTVQNKKKGGRHTCKLTEAVLKEMENLVENSNVSTLKQIQEELQSKLQVKLGTSTVHTGLAKLAITSRKKDRELDQINLPSSILMRSEYAKQFQQNALPFISKCVFIHEMEFNSHSKKNLSETSMIRGKMVNVIVAMGLRGVIHYQIVPKQTVNSQKFYEFVSELCDKIKYDQSLYGGWIILDNTRINEKESIIPILSNLFNLQIFPPYSFMLNPAEYLFEKVKSTAKRLMGEKSSNNLRFTELMEIAISDITESDCLTFVNQVISKVDDCINQIPYSPE